MREALFYFLPNFSQLTGIQKEHLIGKVFFSYTQKPTAPKKKKSICFGGKFI